MKDELKVTYYYSEDGNEPRLLIARNIPQGEVIVNEFIGEQAVILYNTIMNSGKE